MIQFNLSTADNGQRFVTAFVGGALHSANSVSHASTFDAIVGACQAALAGEFVDAEKFVDLFDISKAVERAFERLSERVTVVNGEVLFDGDPAQPGVSKQILRFMEEGADFGPLVNFMEKVQTNPSDNSREQAWGWLNYHDFTITEDGDVMAHKGVNRRDDGGLESGFSGTATVNGVEHKNMRIPNAVGDIIEMPRSQVVDDPHAACHRGLHVGTAQYAKGYANGAMLLVKINPRDIVSVPHDASGEKIRVCRYEVVKVLDAPETRAFYTDDDEVGESLDFTLDSKTDGFAVGDEITHPQYSSDEYDLWVLATEDEDGDLWVEVLYDGDDDDEAFQDYVSASEAKKV